MLLYQSIEDQQLSLYNTAVKETAIQSSSLVVSYSKNSKYRTWRWVEVPQVTKLYRKQDSLLIMWIKQLNYCIFMKRNISRNLMYRLIIDRKSCVMYCNNIRVHQLSNIYKLIKTTEDQGKNSITHLEVILKKMTNILIRILLSQSKHME